MPNAVSLEDTRFILFQKKLLLFWYKNGLKGPKGRHDPLIKRFVVEEMGLSWDNPTANYQLDKIRANLNHRIRENRMPKWITSKEIDSKYREVFHQLSIKIKKEQRKKKTNTKNQQTTLMPLTSSVVKSSRNKKFQMSSGGNSRLFEHEANGSGTSFLDEGGDCQPEDFPPHTSISSSYPINDAKMLKPSKKSTSQKMPLGSREKHAIQIKPFEDERISGSEEGLSEMKKDMENQKEIYEKLKEALKEAEAECRLKDLIIEELKKKLEHRDNLEANLQEELSAVLGQLSAKEAQLKTVGNEVDSTLNEKKTTQTMLEKHIQEAENESRLNEQNIEKLKDKLSHRNEEKSNLWEQLSKLHQKLATKDEQHKIISGKMNATLKEKETLHSKLMEDHKILEARIQEVETECCNNDKTAEELQSQRKSRTDTEVTRRRELSALQEQLAKKERQFTTANKRWDTKIKKKEELDSKLTKANNNRKEQVLETTAESNIRDNKIEQLEEQLIQKDYAESALQNQLSAFHEQLSKKTEAETVLYKQLVTLQKELTTKEEQFAATKKNIAIALDEKKNLVIKLAEKEQKINRLNKRLSYMKKKTEKARLLEKKRRQQHLMKDRVLQEGNRKRVKELDMMKEKKDKLIQERRSEIEILQAKISKLEKLQAQLQEDNEKELKEVKISMDEREKRLLEFKNELERKEKEMENKIVQQKTDLVLLKGQYIDLQREKAQKERELITLQSHDKNLTESVKSSEKKLFNYLEQLNKTVELKDKTDKELNEAKETLKTTKSTNISLRYKNASLKIGNALLDKATKLASAQLQLKTSYQQQCSFAQKENSSIPRSDQINTTLSELNITNFSNNLTSSSTLSSTNPSLEPVNCAALPCSSTSASLVSPIPSFPQVLPFSQVSPLPQIPSISSVPSSYISNPLPPSFSPGLWDPALFRYRQSLLSNLLAVRDNISAAPDVCAVPVVSVKPPPASFLESWPNISTHLDVQAKSNVQIDKSQTARGIDVVDLTMEENQVQNNASTMKNGPLSALGTMNYSEIGTTHNNTLFFPTVTEGSNSQTTPFNGVPTNPAVYNLWSNNNRLFPNVLDLLSSSSGQFSQAPMCSRP